MYSKAHPVFHLIPYDYEVMYVSLIYDVDTCINNNTMYSLTKMTDDKSACINVCDTRSYTNFFPSNLSRRCQGIGPRVLFLISIVWQSKLKNLIDSSLK